MNFFQYQDQARRSTNVLIFYYLLAVVAIIGSVYIAFVGIFLYTRNSSTEPIHWNLLWRPEIFAAVTGITVLIVAIGTIYKIHQLRQGGEGIALMLGGTPLLPNTTDPYERRLLNIVEEMAIAAGTSVPAVFLLDEENSINAFAAGYAPSTAVLGVSRGCMKLLSRDELQGVIGHEFSHILNGDMRLNIRLIGVLNGILVLAMIGYYILRTTGGSRSSSNDKNSGGGVALFGVALLAIGSVGMFFAKMIKSAVSRQREFLADASSVQFTRNPGGIAGALKKIAGYDAGSAIENHYAEEVSHMFFSNGLSGFFATMFATHPSLKERIRRIEPNWSGEIPEVSMEHLAQVEETAAVSGFNAQVKKPAATLQTNANSVAASVGAPTSAHLSHATDLLKSIPTALQTQVHETFGAQAVIFSLLINSETAFREKQLAYIDANSDPLVASETRKLFDSVDSLAEELRLPLATLAIPSLKYLQADQIERFKKIVTYLVGVDDTVTLFEYALTRIVFHALDQTSKNRKSPAVRYQNIADLSKQVQVLLSALAYVSDGDQTTIEKSFQSGIKEAGLAVELLPFEQCPLKEVDEALSHAMCAAPFVKQTLIRACTTCIATDGVIAIGEAELLRAICSILDCPLPPLLGN